MSHYELSPYYQNIKLVWWNDICISDEIMKDKSDNKFENSSDYFHTWFSLLDCNQLDYSVKEFTISSHISITRKREENKGRENNDRMPPVAQMWIHSRSGRLPGLPTDGSADGTGPTRTGAVLLSAAAAFKALSCALFWEDPDLCVEFSAFLCAVDEEGVVRDVNGDTEAV